MNLPKGISARAFIKALESDGFVNVRTSGSHHFYRHPDGRCTTVSYHHSSDTFGIGLLRAMISDVEWTEDDLQRLKLIK